MELSLRIRGTYRVRFEALAFAGFFALAVVFAAAAFFWLEEVLVGAAEALELAFLRATRLVFFLSWSRSFRLLGAGFGLGSA